MKENLLIKRRGIREYVTYMNAGKESSPSRHHLRQQREGRRQVESRPAVVRRMPTPTASSASPTNNPYVDGGHQYRGALKTVLSPHFNTVCQKARQNARRRFNPGRREHPASASPRALGEGAGCLNSKARNQNQARQHRGSWHRFDTVVGNALIEFLEIPSPGGIADPGESDPGLQRC